jgi:hypothetical protein
MNTKGTLSWFGAGLFALTFLLTDIHIAQRRLFWYDEIGTLELMKLPDLSTFWHVQNSFRGDSAPAAYVLLVRLVYQLSGHAEIGVRLLSAVAMMITLVVTFDCARRLTDGVHGLIAQCVMASSFFTYYGYEGRSYALAVLFIVIALWLWLHTQEESRGASVAFGVAIFGAVSMHFNSVLAMVPFGFWEVYRWRPWQKPSPKFLAGMVGLLCAVGIAAQQVRMMHSVGRAPASSWSAPSFAALVRVFSQMFPAGLFVLAVFVILRCLVGGVAKPMANSERLCWLFLTIPLVGFILAMAVTKSFYNRYLISTLPGVAVGFGCLVERHFRGRVSIAFLAFLSVLAIGRQTRDARGVEEIEPISAPDQQLHTRQAMAVEDTLLRDGKRVIITDQMVVRALRYYSRHPELYASYGPNDDPYFCQYLGSACWSLDMAKAHASDLASIYPSGRFLLAMTEAGFQATVKLPDPMVVYFSPR